MCFDLDVAELLAYTKRQDQSFFLASIYLSTKAANTVKEFRYRLRGEKVLIHEVMHCGSTVLNDDETFSFCYFDYYPSFRRFEDAAARKLSERERNPETLNAQEYRDDLIHHSVIPWVAFTSFSHPRRFGTEHSIPKIVFGKYYEDGERVKMPVSVELHHALLDGIHIGKFCDLFQQWINNPSDSLEDK